MFLRVSHANYRCLAHLRPAESSARQGVSHSMKVSSRYRATGGIAQDWIAKREVVVHQESASEIFGWSRTSGRRTSGSSRPSVGVQVLAVFSFISYGKSQFEKFLAKHLEVPDILLPDIRGLLRYFWAAKSRTVLGTLCGIFVPFSIFHVFVLVLRTSEGNFVLQGCTPTLGPHSVFLQCGGKLIRAP